MRPKNRFIASLLLGVLFIVATSQRLYAASPPSGLTVSPSVVQTELSSKNPGYVTQINVSNSYDADIAMTAELKGVDENTGTFVPNGNADPAIAGSLSLSSTDFTVNAHQTFLLSILIRYTPSLTPGGHYATLVLTQKSDKNQKSAVRPAVSISLFIVNKDGEKQSIGLGVATIKRSLFSLPKSVDVAFKNDGNVHVVPRASVQIQSASGLTTFAQGIANEKSQPLLPGKTSQVTVKLTRVRRLWLPKKVSLRVTYRGDGFLESKQYATSFWYVPPVDVLFVVFVLLAFAIGFWVLLKLNNAKKALKVTSEKSQIT